VPRLGVGGAHDDLGELALEIERDLNVGTKEAMREELTKIDEARSSIRRGETAVEVEAVFTNHLPA